MNLFLKLAYLFFIGSVLGWVLELFYRRFISGANPERKWINPGFCVGPYGAAVRAPVCASCTCWRPSGTPTAQAPPAARCCSSPVWP